jgi:hypothetical protein
MIISASRRTDIPAYYSEWFVNRIQEGFLYVRNPMNIHQISNIKLGRDVVDGIVFWTKNPIPMMDKLDKFKDYPYYFQFTLTPYGREIEQGLPSKEEKLIPAFCELSKELGRERVVWRYDPIFLNDKYTMDFHKEHFRILASQIGRYTEKCTVSFLDLYRNTARNIQPFGIRTLNREEQRKLMTEFVKTAEEYGLYIDTCAEEIDLSQLGIKHACCIDKGRFERIGGYKLEAAKDSNQREACGCISSIDIGAYNTCKNGCVYCYANFSKNIVNKQARAHDVNSPLLFGHEDKKNDVIKERKKMESFEQAQLSMF